MPSPSAIAWLSRRAPVTGRDATRIGRRRGGPSRSVGCGCDRGRQARLPARRRVDGEDNTRSHPRRGLRDGLEPRIRPPLHRARPRSRSAVDERRVHAHRQNPVLVRGLPRRLGARCPLLRHRRLHDRAVPPGLSRRADARVRRPGRAALRPLPRLRPRCPVAARRDPGVRDQRSWMHERYLERVRAQRLAVASARGAARATAARTSRAAVDRLLAGRDRDDSARPPADEPPSPSGARTSSASRPAREASRGLFGSRPMGGRWHRSRRAIRIRVSRPISGTQVPTGCQTVFSSRNAEISHGLCSLPAATTRLTLSAARTSSSAVSVAGARDVDRVHVHVRGEDRRQLGAVAGQQVDDPAGQVGGRDRLGELERRERRRLRGDDDRGVPAHDHRSDPRDEPLERRRLGSENRDDAGRLGHGEVEVRPGDGVRAAEHLRQLVGPARRTRRRDRSRAPPRAGPSRRGRGRRRASPSSPRAGRAPGRGCTASRRPTSGTRRGPP